MQNVKPIRYVGRLLGVAILVAATTANVATFEAAAPGADLEPIGGADAVIQILQSSEAVLWTSLGAPVSSYKVLTWPETIGDNELGGALMIERPTNGSAGVIDVGEKPRSITFNTD